MEIEPASSPNQPANPDAPVCGANSVTEGRKCIGDHSPQTGLQPWRRDTDGPQSTPPVYITEGASFPTGPTRSTHFAALPAMLTVSSRATSRRTCRVQAPTKNELVVNLKTARELDLTMPSSVL